MNLRLAIVSHQSLSTLGGISVHIRQLAEAMVRLGVDVEVIVPVHDKVSEYPSYPFKLTPIQVNSKLETVRTIEYTYGVYRYLLENKREFDAVHGSQWSMFFPCLEKRRIGLPIITKFHGTFFYGVINTMKYETKHWLFNESGEILALPVYAYIESICARGSDGIICISNSVKEEVLSLSNGKYRGEVRVIYNGVDAEKFKPLNHHGLRDSYGLKEGDKVILYTGLLEPRKGVHHLIRVAKKLSKSRPELKVLIAGRGTQRYEHYLHRIAESENIFKFLGKVPHERLPELYSLADVCVIPSIYEPLGNVALEAMACGRPVLATNNGGLREIVKHRFSGFLLNLKRLEEEMMGYLNLLFNDDKLKSTMGRNAREYVVNNFSWEKTAIHTVKFIKDLLSKI